MENILAPVSPSSLVAESVEAIAAIKTAAGLTDPQFHALCLPMLRAYADQVQNLPLSAGAFSAKRGAWDFGLVAAMVAYRYAETVIFFPQMGAEERRLLEPQCRYMAFLATLITGIATVAENTKVTSGDDEYHPLTANGNFASWLHSNADAKFSWRKNEQSLSIPAAAAIGAKFIPLSLLENFDLRAVLMLYEAIMPKLAMNGLETTMARVVRSSTQKVCEHYAAKQATAFTPSEKVQGVTPQEAAMVADRIVAISNPTIPVNPLADSAPTTPSAAAPSASTVTASLNPAPVPVTPGLGDDCEHLLRSANKVLIEWFSALRAHPKFGGLADHLKSTEEGIEVPISMLGMFGISGPAIRKMMDDAGLVVGRSADARSLVLHPGLRTKFFAS
jgi:hypothetical protein